MGIMINRESYERLIEEDIAWLNTMPRSLERDHIIAVLENSADRIYERDNDCYEYVDLGLPSGLKWATCNVGASTPTEYGKYFQWGDTVGYEGEEAKAHSTWETTPFNNGASWFDEDYFNSIKDTVCPNGVLAPEYDGVRANMGGDWRMPTMDDFYELFAGTTNEWVKDYQGTGVNGRLFTSMSNGNTMFIPAVGYEWNGSLLNQGISAYLWSSSLNASSPYNAWNLYFNSGDYGVSYSNRDNGFCLRGVCNSK